jgi:hypothetical protein
LFYMAQALLPASRGGGDAREPGASAADAEAALLVFEALAKALTAADEVELFPWPALAPLLDTRSTRVRAVKAVAALCAVRSLTVSLAREASILDAVARARSSGDDTFIAAAVDTAVALCRHDSIALAFVDHDVVALLAPAVISEAPSRTDALATLARLYRAHAARLDDADRRSLLLQFLHCAEFGSPAQQAIVRSTLDADTLDTPFAHARRFAAVAPSSN